MQTAIKNAITTSIAEHRTVTIDVDRDGFDDATLASQINSAWVAIEEDGDNDWSASDGGGVEAWGWTCGDFGLVTWVIVVR